MLVNVLGNPVDLFLDSNGAPLQGGSIYIGQPNTDPTNPANQITVYQDQGLTIPLAQPIKTINGQPSLNGSQIVVYLGLGSALYSLAVLNGGGVVVLSMPSVAPFSLGGSASGSMVVKEFASGTDFIGGTTTSLTLSANFGSGANLWVDFDGVPQHYPDDFTLSGTTLTFTNPIPAGTQKVFTKGGVTASIGTPGAGTVTDSSIAAGSMLYNRIYGPAQKTVKDYGAKGDGVTDDSLAFQAAINSGVCRIPYSAKGYLINTPLNATNLQSLTIIGDVPVQPQWSLGYVNPMGGSIIYGNTGGWLLDITGSNNVLLRNFTISCLPQFLNAALPNLSNPSIAGIVGGTSNFNPSGLNYSGGAGYIFENISVWLGKNGSSVPIYINNGNIGRYINVATLGQYGICLVGGNPLSAAPPYGTFGPVTQSDTNIISGAFCAGYGGQAVMYFEQCNDLHVLETYHTFGAGLAGGAYSGVGYSTYLNNCSNVKLKLGVDSFPFMFRMDGTINQVDVEGLISQGGTATPVGNPAIGFINTSVIKNCNFKVIQFDNRPNNNYLYATQGTAVLASMQGCNFWLDNTNTSNMIFFNSTNLNSIPYFNLNFTGNQDFSVGTTPMTLQYNGSPAGASNYRINMNGNRQGSA